jgi:DinB family protein
MDSKLIFDTLEQNKTVFQNLLENQDQAAYLWRPHSEHWCLLEIVCHLYDEEREDFKIRLKTVLETPGQLPPPNDPVGWVKERKYIDRNYGIMVHKFLEERTQSLEWLRSLSNPNWDNCYEHSYWGKVTAKNLISNWLAHDYLHIRQITRLKYNFLKIVTGESLEYAGKW